MPLARRGRPTLQARVQVRHPRLMLAATAGYERVVLTLRVATQHRRRQAPRRRRLRRDAHLAERRSTLRKLNRKLPAAPPANPTRRARGASRPSILDTAPPPHHRFPRPHAATSIIARTHLSNEPLKRPAPQALGYPRRPARPRQPTEQSSQSWRQTAWT